MKEAKITIWIADDGREFRTESECLLYEKHSAKVAETELRLLSQVLASRVSNLFEEGESIRDSGFPAELFESFDHCGFSDEFREFVSRLNLSARFFVEHLDAFARLGLLVKKIRGAFSALPDSREIAEDLALLPDLAARDVMLHLESLSSLGHILSNLRSEKGEITAYHWNRMEELCRAQEGYLESLQADQDEECFYGHDDDQDDDHAAMWQEEMTRRDPFEGSPF